jgi:hypothetical protein
MKSLQIQKGSTAPAARSRYNANRRHLARPEALSERKGEIKMRCAIHAIVVFSLVICLIGPLATPALAAEPGEPVKEVSAGAMAVDCLLLRPLGLVATAAGAVIYVVSIPFSAPGGNQLYARQKLVQEPAEYTFNRQLGDF